MEKQWFRFKVTKPIAYMYIIKQLTSFPKIKTD